MMIMLLMMMMLLLMMTMMMLKGMTVRMTMMVKRVTWRLGDLQIICNSDARVSQAEGELGASHLVGQQVRRISTKNQCHHHHPHLVSLRSDTVSGPQVDLALNWGHETELSLEVDNRPCPEENHEDYDRIVSVAVMLEIMDKCFMMFMD